MSAGGRYASGAPLTPTPTPVAPLGDGETRNLSTAFKPLAQDPVYDPTEGASGSALPSAGNDQIDNPLFEEQQQEDISGTEYDQGIASHNPNIPFASPRQQEFYSTMYGSTASGIQRHPSSALSDTTLSSMDVSEQRSSQYESPSRNPQQSSFASMGNPAFSSQPLLGSQRSPVFDRQQAPSVAAAGLRSFYQGPFFPRKGSLPLPALPPQQAESTQVPEPAPAQVSGSPTAPVSLGEGPAFSSTPLLAAAQTQSEAAPISTAAYTEEVASPGASSEQQVQFARPLNIPAHPELTEDEQQYYSEPAAASPAAAEVFPHPGARQSPVRPQRAAFADGPMFNGSPLSSPTDVAVYRDNPVFSDEVEQQQMQPEQSAVGHTPAFSSGPILGSVEPEVTLPSVPLYQPPAVAFSEAVPVDHSPALANTPILGSSAHQQQPQQQVITPSLATAALHKASVDLAEPVTGGQAFSSQPIFGTTEQQVYTPTPVSPPVQQEPPAMMTQIVVDQGPSFSSQPIFGGPVPQQEQVATSSQVAPLLLQDPVVNGGPAFSSRPLLGANQQQTQVYTPATVATSQLQTTVGTDAPAFSSRPLLGANQQQSEAYTPVTVATPMQQEPPLILTEGTVTSGKAFSSTPIFGTQQQRHQKVYTPPPSELEPLQDPLYDPTQRRPVQAQQATPAVVSSPRFQSRPVFGQQQQEQSVSADNPWADRDELLANREPSFALASPAPPRQGIIFHDNSLFESSDQPQILSDGITFQSSPPLSGQQSALSASARQPAWQAAAAAPVFHSVSPFDAPQHVSPAVSLPAVAAAPAPAPAPFFSSQPTLGLPVPAPTATAQQDTAQLDTAQRVRYSPVSTFASPAPTRAFAPPIRAAASSGGLAFSDRPLLGSFEGAVTVPPTSSSAVAVLPTPVDEPLSDPLYDPAAQRAVRVPVAPARPAALLEPLDDPLYDPLERRPVVAQSAIHHVKPVVLQPLDDPLYDPTVQRPPMAGQVISAAPLAPHGPRGSRFVPAQNSRFLQHVDDPLYDPAAVESASGLQRDVTHRGEQVGTPHFARQQQQPSAFGAAPAAGSRAQDIVTRPVVRSARRPPRTVHLTDIGRPAPLPPVQEQYVAPEPKPEQLGAVDVLPQDDHYVKPTAYDELGANARSALSGAGWKTTWAMEMEAAAQRGGQGTAPACCCCCTHTRRSCPCCIPECCLAWLEALCLML